MILIEEIESRRDKKDHLRKYGKFLCPNPICNKIVERSLENGLRQKSCGCIYHMESFTKLYVVWINMKQRCDNINHKSYKDYGDRGITVCPEWAESYIVFRDWALSNNYSEGLQINRIKNEGNYEPNNCNFVTPKENSNNRRSNKIKSLEIANEIRYLHSTVKYTQKELAKAYDVHQTVISSIINNKIWKNTK